MIKFPSGKTIAFVNDAPPVVVVFATTKFDVVAEVIVKLPLYPFAVDPPIEMPVMVT
jgi:hypothetical protein